MKKTFKMRYKFIALIGIVAVGLAGCTSSGGSSSSGGTVTPTSLSGAVAKGYVQGAYVIADKLVDGTTLGNGQLDRDNGEVFDVSGDDGSYSLTLTSDYGDYVLITVGGIDASTGNPAPPMIAPPPATGSATGTRNVTPVTTMVSLNPNLRSQIGEDKFDQDIASPTGADGSILALAMTAKATLECLESQASMTATQKREVMRALAAAVENKDLTDGTQIASAAQTAVKNVVQNTEVFSADEVVFDADAAAAAISTAVTNIVGTISLTDTVTESSVKDAVETAITDTADEVAAAITSIRKVSVSSLDLKNSAGDVYGTITSATKSLTLSQAAAYDSERLVFTLAGTNTFADSKTYSDVKLIVGVNDVGSLREVTGTISGVNVTIAANATAGAAAVTFEFGANPQLSIVGTDSNGNTVNVTLTNTSVQGDSTLVSFNGATVTLDMDALGAKIEAESNAEQLYEIGLPGTYTVTMTAEGAPLIAVAKAIIVNN